MGRTKTSGITTDKDGNRTVNKVWRGQRIYARLGQVSQEEAEQWLAGEIERRLADASTDRGPDTGHAEPVFAVGAAKYLTEKKDAPSGGVIAHHINLLLPYIGTLPLNMIHDGTLEAFKTDRLEGLVGMKEGDQPRPVTPTTVNRSLEVVRTVLNRAARVWRDESGKPLLDIAPPLISMLDENEAPPYPLTWEEQDRFFPLLAPHLAEMALFGVNTGLRDDNICGLRWSWEVPVPEVGRSVFIVPADAFKGRKVSHVVVLNDAAWSIIEDRRRRRAADETEGKPVTDYVFAYSLWYGKGETGRLNTINNNGWQRARKVAELPQVRVHDLRHTYATRLRLAGVSQEDRAALLGHEGRSMPEHYAAADVGRLIELSNRTLNRAGTRTLLRVVNG